MKYQINDEFGLSIYDLVRRFPQTSFPTDQPIVGFLNVSPYEPTPAPNYDALRFTCREVAPIDGKQQWEVIPLPEEQVAQNIRNVGESIRSQRNQLLSESDWTQLPDSTVNKQQWATYRQALRDITKQEGFPLNVQFPEKP